MSKTKIKKRKPKKIKRGNMSLNLYDLNKSIIAQMNPLTQEQLDKRISLINEFQHKEKNVFYMLYGKEISYFTIFAYNSVTPELKNLGIGVIECLKNVGEIYSIEKIIPPEENAESAVEIWVKTKDQEDKDLMTCLYLFPYDRAIVSIGGQ